MKESGRSTTNTAIARIVVSIRIKAVKIFRRLLLIIEMYPYTLHYCKVR